MQDKRLNFRLLSAADLDGFSIRVQLFLHNHGLSDTIQSDIMVIIDELLSNLLKYGGGHFLDVRLECRHKLLVLLCLDDGAAFNPLTSKRPDLDLPMEEREIGGLGIELVMGLTETQHYWRENGYNHIELTLPLPQ